MHGNNIKSRGEPAVIEAVQMLLKPQRKLLQGIFGHFGQAEMGPNVRQIPSPRDTPLTW